MDFLYDAAGPGHHVPSYYTATATPLPSFPILEGTVKADVCVVGGGYTGLSAALHLARQGRDVVLLDAHRVGWGASGRNGGQVGSGQRVAQDVLAGLVGSDDAQALWAMGEDAKALVRALIDTHGIACDYRPGVLHADHRARFVPHTRAQVELLNTTYGYSRIRFVDKAEIRVMLGSPAYHGGALDEGAGHLHPLNFALGLARAAAEAGVRIFERSRVEALAPGHPACVRVRGGEVRADHVILAANGYLGRLSRPVAARVMPINGYMVATEPLGEPRARALIRDNVAVADSRFVVNYFRLSADHRLLFGGGECYGYAPPRDIPAFVRPILLSIFPQLASVALDYGWGGTLGITRSRLPHVARVAPGVVSVSGFSGHGVALATLCGAIVAEALGGRATRFDLLERLPTPPFPGGILSRRPLLALAMLWFALRDRF
ncbi:NAD(P)/FAD-dependent oxidoreductase [Pararhodospirillum oryzae]|uniref:Gamma-glutamylputrescine oxidase n=1 Tax=Pararhodospirillum oryzae TaxID=478448 RepID=A0A512HAH0_9PROT|nr:FAD-binding oxidoreductase [Pararhodospirillum oryzae]GEO82428.1 gamma-glutamylputrescine oxidase [Pararhodospirillum oryzae]